MNVLHACYLRGMREPSTVTLPWSTYMCQREVSWGVLISEVSWLVRCPDWWGVLISEVSWLVRCPDQWDVLISEVSWSVRCPDQWGVLIGEVSWLVRCSDQWGVLDQWGILISENCPDFRVNKYTNMVTTSVLFPHFRVLIRGVPQIARETLCSNPISLIYSFSKQKSTHYTLQRAVVHDDYQ